jgi:3-methyladenine DNA glycosylase/8-oxoguanine DNA glycosylase
MSDSRLTIGAPLESFANPPSPVQLPERSAADGILACDGRRVRRFIHVAGAPVLVTVCPARSGDGGAIRFVAEALDPDSVEYRDGDLRSRGRRSASAGDLATAISRVRFSLGVDEDLADFFSANRDDRLLGPVISRRPWARPQRRPWPWESLAWTIVGRGLEPAEAARIQRRVVHRWAPRVFPAGSSEPLFDFPSSQTIADAAPAELVSKGLTEARAIALARSARELVSGRVDLDLRETLDRLLLIREVDRATMESVAAEGRGDLDALPISDPTLAKLVGRIAGLGRRADAGEVEGLLSPYAPWRGLAAAFILAGYSRAVVEGPPLRAVA